MSKKLLSVVVSVFNGEQVLEGCLKSAMFADEVVVINNSSTDKTLGIAKKYTDKIFTRPNNLMLNINKNFGFSKATSDWIFCLDADEQITPELKEEILSTINSLPRRQAGQLSTASGYWVPRKNIIFGKWIEHTGWYPDYQLRLFRNGKGRFPEEHVHEMVKIEGKVGQLSENIVHYNYDGTSQFLQKLGTIYGPNEADQLIKKGYNFDWKDSIRFPVNEFLSRFFAREGYKDGLHGLMLSLLMAFYHLIVFSYIWEKQKFKQINDDKLLEDTEQELAHSSKELFFWFSKEKTKLIKNPLKQLFHKILRKIKP